MAGIGANGQDLFLVFVTLLQVVMAIGVTWRRPASPVRLVVVLLFMLNAVFTAGLAIQSPAPDWALRADAGTNILLLALALLLAKAAPLDEQPWTPRSRVILSSSLAIIGIANVVWLLWPGINGPVLEPLSEKVPQFAGFAALLVLGTNRLLRTPAGPQANLWLFVLIAFGARGAEFSYLYAAKGILSDPAYFTSGIPPVLSALARIGLVGATIYAMSALAVAAVRRRQGARREAFAFACLGAAFVLGLAVAFGAVGTAPGYIVSLFTLVLVRPIFAGLAFEPLRTAQGVTVLAAAAALFLVLKVALDGLFGMPFSSWGVPDVVAIACMLFASPLLVHVGVAVRRIVRHQAPEPVHLKDAPPLAHRLVAFLQATHGGTPDGLGSTAREIQTGTGISPNNLAGEVRRASRLLRRMDPPLPEDATMMETTSPSVRGRKFYRLSAEGRARAARLLATRGAPSTYEVTGPPEHP